MAEFARYLVADWSAADGPRRGRDSIWLAATGAGRGGRPANPPTRTEAARALAAAVERAVATGDRLLVAVDFPLGLPAGFHAVARAALGGGDAPWEAWWEFLRREIADDLGGRPNRSNRFEVADGLNRRSGVRWFWGRPETDRYAHLDALPVRDRAVAGLAPNPCSRWREAETVAGRGIKSCWQLFGGVTVGSQSLTGIPVLAGVRAAQPAGAVAVWPFEPVRAPSAAVVLAECWPTRFVAGAELDAAVERTGLVRDAVQVTATATALQRADRDGLLTEWLAVPSARRAAVRREEGWILGC